MCRCKGFVHTRSHPEGSIAESYLFDETLTYCSRHIKGETQFTRQIRNDQGLGMETSSTTPFFSNLGRGLVGKHSVLLDNKTWIQAHRYVLFNYDHIEPYLKQAVHFLFCNLHFIYACC